MIKFYDCDFCANLFPEMKNGHGCCRAFPDGIPYEHMDLDVKNLKECNNGIRYEKEKEDN